MSVEKEKEAKETIDLNQDPPVLCSQRWILAYIGFLGFGVIYALRVNISVAVVCMIKSANTTSGEASINDTLEVESECGILEKAASHSNDRAELNWDQTTKTTILASFFYGYIVTQIPGGWLADRYGGKRVLGITVFISSVLTILFPVCARTSVYLVYTIRVSLGLLTAVSFPAMHAMWGKWAPPLERSKLTTLCYAGTTLGNVVTFSTSGLLCAYGFDSGWGSIFYLTGLLGLMWSAAWYYFAADKPTKHPRITDIEKKYIVGSIEYRTDRKTTTVPWLAMAKSKCLWACLTAHVCNNWTNYTLLTNIPTFMKEVLKYDIKSNGALSSVPYLCQFVMALAAGQIADYIRVKGLMSTTLTRKVMQTIAFAGAGGCLIGTGYCTCDTRTLAVALLSAAVMFTGFGRAGYVVNHVDFAPKYAGVLFGITNTVATIPGMVAPIFAGYLTPNNTPNEWRVVFFVCAAFDAFGIIIFGLFASGEMQDWAKDDDIDIEIEMDKNGKVIDVKTEKQIYAFETKDSSINKDENAKTFDENDKDNEEKAKNGDENDKSKDENVKNNEENAKSDDGKAKDNDEHAKSNDENAKSCDGNAENIDLDNNVKNDNDKGRDIDNESKPVSYW